MTTEISPRQAWDLLAADKHARLVDVRTEPEWAYVGVPDLADLGKAVAKISWHVFPEMRVNSEFIGKLKATYDPARPVIFMCRSGGRSLVAAKAAFEAGFAQCFSLAGGFEGDVDEQGHRGTKAGWKAEGLSWRQP
jgi:rhodanese-related sulfurtransferase